mmetsp:Transcript_16543/g.28684  ORF Transcript_16543/g.28684 Transcript_16543/m.28684 type:complete len:213 (+) Transcript_16543:904-1542(+)
MASKLAHAIMDSPRTLYVPPPTLQMHRRSVLLLSGWSKERVLHPCFVLPAHRVSVSRSPYPCAGGGGGGGAKESIRLVSRRLLLTLTLSRPCNTSCHVDRILHLARWHFVRASLHPASPCSDAAHTLQPTAFPCVLGAPRYSPCRVFTACPLLSPFAISSMVVPSRHVTRPRVLCTVLTRPLLATPSALLPAHPLLHRKLTQSTPVISVSST